MLTHNLNIYTAGKSACLSSCVGTSLVGNTFSLPTEWRPWYFSTSRIPRAMIVKVCAYWALPVHPWGTTNAPSSTETTILVPEWTPKERSRAFLPRPPPEIEGSLENDEPNPSEICYWAIISLMNSPSGLSWSLEMADFLISACMLLHIPTFPTSWYGQWPHTAQK